MNEPTTPLNPAGGEPDGNASPAAAAGDPHAAAAPGTEPPGATDPQPGSTAAAPASGTVPAAGDPQPGERPRPRTGPIVWGALILAFCVYIAQRTISPGTVDTAAWIVATVIGLGLLLLGVAVAVLVRGGRR